MTTFKPWTEMKGNLSLYFRRRFKQLVKKIGQDKAMEILKGAPLASQADFVR